MKMQEMNKAFEKEGFNVDRYYVVDKRTYVFSIRKDGIVATDEFTWNCNLSNYVNHERQEKFIRKLISTWEKEYEKSNSTPKLPNINAYDVRRDLAIHGGEAELVVNNNVYPIRITDITVECLSNEVPRMSVEGELKSFTPERKEDLAKSMWRMMLNSVYGIPSSGYILAARGNGKSLMATKQIYDMIGRSNPFAIEKVIFNGPATIVMWMDGTKTIVKCQDGDTFDPEKGLAMAISKKAFGNKGNYCDIFKKALKNCDIYYEETVNNNPHIGDVYNAYQKLLDTLNNKKATKSDLGIAMEEAIGYLGHALG